MKRTINESQLRKIISESIKRTLAEGLFDRFSGKSWYVLRGVVPDEASTYLRNENGDTVSIMHNYATERLLHGYKSKQMRNHGIKDGELLGTFNTYDEAEKWCEENGYTETVYQNGYNGGVLSYKEMEKQDAEKIERKKQAWKERILGVMNEIASDFINNHPEKFSKIKRVPMNSAQIMTTLDYYYNGDDFLSFCDYDLIKQVYAEWCETDLPALIQQFEENGLVGDYDLR